MKTVIEIALDTGFDADDETTLTSLQRFAALVIANNPPQSSMAWQEGYEAGKQAEREACAVLAEKYEYSGGWLAAAKNIAAAIRARGNT